MPASSPASRAPTLGPVRIGCSGWNYRHWRGLFYPEKGPVKHWFAHYAATFDTVEINNTFYRLPRPEVFDAWREQAPAGFRYAVKANRYLTQSKKLKDCEEPVERMIGAVRHLGDALGPLLYQLPPRFKLNLERLEAFLALLPKDLTHVFEFRDNSWNCDAVWELLARYNASFCVHDMTELVTPRVATGPIAYLRFHGGEGKYWGRYPEPVLAGWADWIAEQVTAGRSVWAYFNNDIGGAAIEDALTLRAMLRQAIG